MCALCFMLRVLWLITVSVRIAIASDEELPASAADNATGDADSQPLSQDLEDLMDESANDAEAPRPVDNLANKAMCVMCKTLTQV
jgi:hypothetical protein